MITDDGHLVYDVRANASRMFGHRMRHIVNPVVGIAAGFLFGAALFVVAVQGVFGVRPSIVAILVALVAVVAYLVAVGRARQRAGALGAYALTLGPDGVEVRTNGGGSAQPWSAFVRWLEDDHDVVLVSGRWREREIVVLPKSGVPEEELDLIREVLHSHIDPDDEPLEDAFVEMGWDEEPERLPRRRAE
ncbi:YcxB family protein [Ammonicoccus fulvus]|uniref:YcxB family protein n=1 Tax=Ammonicoccus fulvus TaxID=3138240 RepID=A0ABZ3FQL3_9ACTN